VERGGEKERKKEDWKERDYLLIFFYFYSCCRTQTKREREN
jgi:hypothetical protein